MFTSHHHPPDAPPPSLYIYIFFVGFEEQKLCFCVLWWLRAISTHHTPFVLFDAMEKGKRGFRWCAQSDPFWRLAASISREWGSVCDTISFRSGTAGVATHQSSLATARSRSPPYPYIWIWLTDWRAVVPHFFLNKLCRFGRVVLVACVCVVCELRFAHHGGSPLFAVHVQFYFGQTQQDKHQRDTEENEYGVIEANSAIPIENGWTSHSVLWVYLPYKQNLIWLIN